MKLNHFYYSGQVFNLTQKVMNEMIADISTCKAAIAELEARTCNHGDYKIWGTSDCNHCDTGRITIYYLSGNCVECQHDNSEDK